MKTALAVLVLLLAAGGAYAEYRLHEAGRRTATTAVRAAEAVFRPAPIPAGWILAGQPVTEVAEVGGTDDGAARVYLWRTTAATFRWVHEADEIVTILRGEVFVTDADGRRHHLGVGDVAHFPAGAVQVWEVPDGLLKSAVLRSRMPGPVEAALRWARRLKGLVSGPAAGPAAG